MLPLRLEKTPGDLSVWFLCVKACIYSLQTFTCSLSVDAWDFKSILERYRGNRHSCCFSPPIKTKHTSGVNLTKWLIISFVRGGVSTGITVAAGRVSIFSAFPRRAFGDSWARSGGGGEWAHGCNSLRVFLCVCLSLLWEQSAVASSIVSTGSSGYSSEWLNSSNLLFSLLSPCNSLGLAVNQQMFFYSLSLINRPDSFTISTSLLLSSLHVDVDVLPLTDRVSPSGCVARHMAPSCYSRLISGGLADIKQR